MVASLPTAVALARFVFFFGAVYLHYVLEVRHVLNGFQAADKFSTPHRQMASTPRSYQLDALVAQSLAHAPLVVLAVFCDVMVSSL